MKILNIHHFIVFFVFAILTFSCSNEEGDPTPDLEDVSLSILEGNQLIQLPQGLLSSNDPYANQAASLVQAANAVRTLYAGYLIIPGTADQSVSPIGATNGGDYLVRSWEANGSGVLYQVHEENGKYIFEVFAKDASDADYQRLLRAEEEIGENTGSMTIYDDEGNPTSSAYEWETEGDEFTFEIIDENEEIVIMSNASDNSGSISRYEDGTKTYESEWDSEGNGSWIEYDAEGDVESQGEWNAG